MRCRSPQRARWGSLGQIWDPRGVRVLVTATVTASAAAATAAAAVTAIAVARALVVIVGVPGALGVLDGQDAHGRVRRRAAGGASRRAQCQPLKSLFILDAFGVQGLVLLHLGRDAEVLGAGRSFAVRGGLALGLALASLDALFSHCQGSVDIMQLEVESTGVADGLALVVAPPQGGGRGATVGAAQAHAPGHGRALQLKGHSPLRLRRGSGGAVHLVVEAAGVAQVVARAVPTPQGRGDGTAVDALPGFAEPRILRRICGGPQSAGGTGKKTRNPTDTD